MDRARHQLLAGPALADDEHADVAGRDLVDQVGDPADDRAVADDGRYRARPGHHAAQAVHLAIELEVGDGPLERDDQDIELDRLDDVVVGPGPDRADGALELGVAGHHHGEHARVSGSDLPAQLDAAHAGHTQVGQHDVDVVVTQPGQGRQPRGGQVDLVTAAAQRAGQLAGPVVVVVDQEDAAAHGQPREAHAGSPLAICIDMAPLRLWSDARPSWPPSPVVIELDPSDPGLYAELAGAAPELDLGPGEAPFELWLDPATASAAPARRGGLIGRPPVGRCAAGARRTSRPPLVRCGPPPRRRGRRPGP